MRSFEKKERGNERICFLRTERALERIHFFIERSEH